MGSRPTADFPPFAVHGGQRWRRPAHVVPACRIPNVCFRPRADIDRSLSGSTWTEREHTLGGDTVRRHAPRLNPTYFSIAVDPATKLDLTRVFAWSLQLLSCRRQRPSPMEIPQRGDGAAAQVVESTKPETEPDVAATEPAAGALGVPAALDRGGQGMKSGVCEKARSSARVSMTEKPGAGKPHAGICAGGAG
jgi:hypothetical protein